MFEKEAEEIANKRCHEIMCYGHCSFSSPKHHRCGEWHREYECALKGAEFGYNKGKSEAKEIIQQLVANTPNTYSGTDIELQQKKMFSFQNAVDKAEQFLKDTE